MKITLDLPPSSNRYWRVGNNRIYRSDEAVGYCEYVALLCNTAGIEPLDGDVRVTLNIYRKRRSGDTDNFLKVCLDSLQSHAYHNDAQIAELHATRHDTEPHAARVEISIERIGDKS